MKFNIFHELQKTFFNGNSHEPFALIIKKILLKFNIFHFYLLFENLTHWKVFKKSQNLLVKQNSI